MDTQPTTKKKKIKNLLLNISPKRSVSGLFFEIISVLLFQFKL